MPIRDCMSSSPFCPVHKYEEMAPELKKGCDVCVEEGLKNNEIPKCFFCSVESSDDIIDFSIDAFAKKVMEKAKKLIEK